MAQRQTQPRKPLSRQKRLNEMLLIHSWDKKTRRVGKLLDIGAQLEYEPGNGWTPLFNAAYSGDRKTVVMLIKRGADIDKVDGTGHKVIDYAPSSRLSTDLGDPVFLRFLKFTRESMDKRNFNSFMVAFGECVGWA
ncbi:MAG: hypothetical protein NTY68_00110 [Candidatus Micrarchaeota archaeon]|nr:hypothetical protein [Candidatus Micrarchaeota archaeon]